MSYALHIVPVGRSIAFNTDRKLTGPAKAAIKPALDPGPYQTSTGPARPVRHLLCTAAAPGTGIVDPAAVFPAAVEPLREARATPSLCVEWRSLEIDKLRPPATGQHRGDAYVFVSTDTEAGLLAATAVAVGTANKAAIRYIDDPATEQFRRHRIEPGQVHVCRIPDLDLSEPDRIGTATWQALGSIGHVAAETARQPADVAAPWRIVVHLSGGYKAMIPSMLVMAEAISSLLAATEDDNKHNATISAWTLHEDAPDTATGRIEVGIRQLRGDPYHELYRIRDDIAAGRLPASGFLIGSCLDIQHRITPFGTIMTAVLPATDPGPA